VARDLSTHRRWALRLFMVVNAGWFFRIGMMNWIFMDRRPEAFTGPVINVLSFVDYLLPLVMLEIYLRTKDSAGAGARLALAACLVALTVAMGVGMFGATTFMWLPRMQHVVGR
jgi:hypothetical protein